MAGRRDQGKAGKRRANKGPGEDAIRREGGAQTWNGAIWSVVFASSASRRASTGVMPTLQLATLRV